MVDGRTAATGKPEVVLAPERLSQVWRVDASLDERGAAVHANWLGR